MNKGIAIGIIIAVAIAITFGLFMTNDNTVQPAQTEEEPTETEVVSAPKSYSVQLEEGLRVQTSP